MGKPSKRRVVKRLRCTTCHQMIGYNSSGGYNRKRNTRNCILRKTRRNKRRHGG